MASTINDGLYNYEDELWEPSDEEQWIETPGGNGNAAKHVEVISQEEMERLRPEPVPHQNPPSPPQLPRGRLPSLSEVQGEDSSAGSSAGTTPQSLPAFHHPSHSLLKENGFTQLQYTKYHSRCLKER